MKIIVLIKGVWDTRVPVECVDAGGRLNEDWNVPILNPDDALALAEALKIKKDIAGVHITVVHLGPPSGERLIREALALGCDAGLRIWDEGLENLHAAAKHLIFARVAEISGFDLLFCGGKSLDTGSAQLGLLLASSLKIRCITRVAHIDAIRAGTVEATRKLEGGCHEQVESSRPLVIAVEADEDRVPYASFPDVFRAAEASIPCLDLPRIGISPQTVREAESRLAFGPLRIPVPRTRFMQAPDSTLPAFERRRRIAEGTATMRQRKIVRGSEDWVAEQLFQTLLRQGWLRHLRETSGLV